MTMTMKRKRSDSEISFCSNSILSSPQSNAMDVDMCMSSSNKYQNFQEITPSHLSSRTRKRFRDNRPPESNVHEHTLSLLFSAQKQPNIDPLPSYTMPAMSTDLRPTESTHQSSLHAYWALPSKYSSGTSTPASPPVNLRLQTTCEDCDANLLANDDDSMDVDIDLCCDPSVDFGCSACGKQVCDHCSISNIFPRSVGAQRQCLGCAGQQRWKRGFGGINQN